MDRAALGTDRIVDLPDLFATAVTPLRRAIQERGLHLATTAVPARLPVCADPERLGDVFTTLLANAVRATPARGRIDVVFTDRPGFARLAVKDGGRGIPPEVAGRLFDDPAVSRSFAGLGLDDMRRIIESHGGTIAAESRGLGRGTTFTVELPLQGEPAAWPPELERRARPRDPSRVLVVDDDEDTRDAVAEVLRLAGFEVSTASSVTEGLASFKTARPDVLVSDVAMPGADGYSLVRTLRAEHSSFGAVALTAYASRHEREKAREAGFDEYLVKPASLTDLTAAVAALAVRRQRPLAHGT
jgi:CheY-like chemotaxis protein